MSESHATHANVIRFDNVSKFYGEVLGVNRVNLEMGPGITGLVGPNGSGKSTLMNLMTGLLRPTKGSVTVLGCPSNQPESFFRNVGYLTQVDAFPERLTGYDFVYSYLRVHGHPHADADQLTWKAIDRVGLRDAAGRKMGGYSKGMRQRIRLAQATAHEPQVLVLDEPLNGLDPMARSEVIEIFKALADDGHHVVISSHILHEVDMIADQVVLLSSGYVVAEGDVLGVRDEIDERPIQVLLRCTRPSQIAARLFGEETVVEVALHDDHRGLMVRTLDARSFYRLRNRLVIELEVDVETISIADNDVRAVYAYLIEHEGEG
ncbi:MAG: ABC transporter ATP-binding protein [Holophagales bacterium]|nr:ABC transporter ATP-binding protein [Holophagales bacterium]